MRKLFPDCDLKLPMHKASPRPESFSLPRIESTTGVASYEHARDDMWVRENMMTPRTKIPKEESENTRIAKADATVKREKERELCFTYIL